RVQAEVHLLPLAASEQYRSLRQLVGGNKLQVGATPGALVDFQLGMGDGAALSLYLGGGERVREMVEMLLRWEEGALSEPRQAYDRLFWKMPAGVALVVRDQARDEDAGRFVENIDDQR